MTTNQRPAREPTTPGSDARALLEAARAEADARAHDRVSPDGFYEAIGAVNLYVEAFVAGAKWAATR